MEGPVGASLQRPASGDKRVPVEIAVVLAAMLDECSVLNVSEIVKPFLKLAVATSSCRKIEGRRSTADRRGALDIGVHITAEPTLRSRGDFTFDPRLLREHHVQHLTLAGIVRAEEIAWPKLDTDHLLSGDSRQCDVERLRFRARPRAVDDDVPGRPCKA